MSITQEEFKKLTRDDLEKLKFVLDSNGKVCVRGFGVKGDDGNDGKTILHGTIDPTTEGVDGDFYINTTSLQIFGPKTGGVWGTGTDLIGTDGTDGNGIASIVLLSGDHSPGTLDTYRITFTDTTTFDFQVYNGANGVLFNVKDYGAIGDGIADDTTAFQNTVNATGVNGGRIIIPYGTYNLTTFPSIGTKSIYFDIDVGARFNGAGYPAMNTNYGQVAVGPYIKSQSDYVSPIPNGGIATYNIEMIQPSTYVGQSVGLYVGARGSSPDVGANVWAINPLITANAGAGGTYQCIEVDVNNNSADAIVKGVSVSGLGNYNPDVAFEAVRADETRWKVGMELHHNIIGMILHGNIASVYEAIKIENLSSANTTNKGIINRYYGRTFNAPTTKQIANIEINPVDPNWVDCRYTINLMEDSTLKSAFEIKQDGVFFGFDTISQTHKIRQGDGSTQFRNTTLQYIELKTDNNYHYITGTVNASTGGSASGKEILIENKDQSGLRYKFNGVEVGRVTKNGSIIIGKVTDDGSYLQVSNASASGTYVTIKRGISGFDIALNSANNEINSTGKVMRIGTTDALPISLHTNGGEKMRVHSSGNISIGDAGDTNKLKVTGSVGDTAGLIYLSTSGTGKKAFKFDEGFTTTTAPTGGAKYITIDIGGVEYKLIAQATT